MQRGKFLRSYGMFNRNILKILKPVRLIETVHLGAMAINLFETSITYVKCIIQQKELLEKLSFINIIMIKLPEFINWTQQNCWEPLFSDF